MTDHYLKFYSQEQARDALSACFGQGDGLPIMQSASHFAVEVGAITRETGETVMVDGEQVQVRAAVPGYHVNLRLVDASLPATLEQYLVLPPPATPDMDFA